MSGRKKYSVLREPVHGDVYLTHEELSVLDTRQMQRMRGVRQLGTAYLVYPGAVHTRFDHMIGSTHVAQQMIDAINLSFELNPGGLIRISDEEARVIRLAALVHDITHIPYGHSLEDQDGIFERHDSEPRFRAMLGPSTEVGARLSQLGVAEDVLAILTSRSEAGAAKIPPYWWQIVSGTICADTLDYLARDAYFTGLHLQVDPRVTSYFKVDRVTGNLFIDLCKHDLLREDILSEIVRMLEARYYFSERVYYHHAKVASGAMIARAVELTLAGGLVARPARALRRGCADRPARRGARAPASPALAPPLQARLRLPALRERGRTGGPRGALLRPRRRPQPARGRGAHRGPGALRHGS
jgi:hypothetical protein